MKRFISLLLVIALLGGLYCNSNSKSSVPFLCTAIKNGNTAFVNLLLMISRDVNCRDDIGNTPLIIAAQKGNCKLLKKLIKHGANVNMVGGKVKASALHYSIILKNNDCFQCLIENGANVDLQAMNGITPLMLAVQFNNFDFVKELIKKKCNVNFSDDSGKTALLYATEHNHLDIATLLLDSGANVNVGNKNGSKPVHIAAYLKNNDLLQLLIKKGTNVNSTDNAGVTPLMDACMAGNNTGVIALILNGADIDYKNKNGISALAVAEKFRKDTCIALIKYHQSLSAH